MVMPHGSLPINDHGHAADLFRERLLCPSAEGLAALRSINAGQPHPLRAFSRIEHLDGIAIENPHDRAREGFGVGEGQEQQGVQDESESQAKQQNRHKAPRTTDMGTLKGRPFAAWGCGQTANDPSVQVPRKVADSHPVESLIPS